MRLRELSLDGRVAIAIALLVLASRLPFLAHQLFQWDSVLYARAIEDGFHVDSEIAWERPQPPGYLLYVWIGSAFRAVTGDSNSALVLIAVVASVLASVGVYLLTRRFVAPLPAAVAAAGIAFSPLFWQQSEVALPYTLLALVSVGLAAAFHHARSGRNVLLIAALYGVAAGFRQDVLLILGPLWLWSIAPLSWTARARALAVLSLACLLWLVPSAALSGGLGAYLAAGLRQGRFVAGFSVAERGLDGLVHNLALTAYSLGGGIGAFALLLVVAGGARLLARRGLGSGERAFLGLWVVPPLVVYVSLHIGEPGYVLSVLPGLFVLSAVVVARVAPAPRVTGALGGALVTANAVAFIAFSGPFSAESIAAHDRSIGERAAYVRSNFAPARTYVLAQFDYEMVRYYLPEYRALFSGDAPQTLSLTPIAVTLHPHRDSVVLFGAVPDLGPGLRRQPAPGDLAASLATVDSDGDLTFSAYEVETQAGDDE